MAYKEEKRKLIRFILIITGIFLFSMISVSALNWQTPPKPANITNLTDINNYLSYLNETKYPNGSQIPADIVNKTTGTNWVGLMIDDILELIYSWLGTTNSRIDNVNSTLISFMANITNMSEVKIYYEYLNVTTSGGVGSGYTVNLIGFEISRITITPVNVGTKYRFLATEKTSATIIDQDRMIHIGVWDIYKSHAINNDNVLINITSANPDDTFQIKLTYIDNFRP